MRDFLQRDSIVVRKGGRVMAGFLKSIFGRTQSESPSRSQSQMAPVENMSLDDITELVRGAGQIQVCQLIDVYRRLIDIAMLDHHVPDDVRERALVLSEAVEKEIRRSFEAGGGAAFNEAVERHTEQIRFYGYGSLKWLLDENSIPPAGIAAFAAKEEHSHLVPVFTEIFDEPTLKSIKPDLIAAIAKARRLNEVHSAVVTLYGLAMMRDPAIECLLSPDELNLVRVAPSNYEAARSVLVSLGLLPASDANHFDPMPDAELISDIVSSLLNEFWKEIDSDHIASLIDDKETCESFAVARLIVAMNIVVDQLSSMYGDCVSGKVRDIVIDALPRVKEMGLAGMLEMAKVTERAAYDLPRCPPDVGILDALANQGKPGEPSDKETEAKLPAMQVAARLLATDRQRVFERFRITFWFVVRDAAGAQGEPFPDMI